MVAQRPNFGGLLAPGLRSVFFDKYNAYPDEYTKLFNMNTSERKYEDDQGITGFGFVPEKDEGVGIVYDDPIQGYSKRYTHKTYGLGFRITEEMWEDDLYGIMRKMPKALGKSMRLTIETDAANVLNRAFTAGYTGGDGIVLCASTHPLVGGGTGSNVLSTGSADLSETSLEQAIINLAATTDDRGLLLALRPMKLVVAPGGAWTAARTLESTLTPATNYNAINPAKGIMPYEINHYLTDADGWFIYCDEHELNWFWRRRPRFDQGNDFDTEDAKYKATARWSNGWSDWRGIFGSPGV